MKEENNNIPPRTHTNQTTQTKKTVNKKRASFNRSPDQIRQMQQNFNELYISGTFPNRENANNAPSSGGNSGGGGNPSGGGNPNNGGLPLNSLSQIAPIFNLLSGGKNPQLSNLMNVLGTGNMDMNKMLNAMAQSQVNNPVKSVNTNPTSKEKEEETSDIKNLPRV